MSFPIPPNVGGSGFGSDLGPTPTYDEVDSTAAAQLAKNQAGIRPTTDDVLLTDLFPQNRFKDSSGYPATPNRPVLEHPIETGFGPTSLVKKNDESWQQSFQNLLSKLPPETQEILKREQGLFYKDRTPEFTVLSNLLMMAAKNMTQLEAAARGAVPGGTEATAETINLALGGLALAQSRELGSKLHEAIARFLSQAGPNYRDFDPLNSLNTQLKELLAQIGASPLEKEERDQVLNELATGLETLVDEFATYLVGKELQIFSDLTAAFALVTAANTLPNASQFIAFKMAALGLLGGGIEKALANLFRGIYSDPKREMSYGGRMNMVLYTTFAIIAGIGIASQLANPDQGLAGRLVEEEIEASGTENDLRGLYYLNAIGALTMLMESGLIGQFYSEAIDISAGKGSSGKNGVVSLLTELTHFLMLIAAAREHGSGDPAEFIRQHPDRFARALKAAEILTRGAPPDLAVGVRQLQGALNEGRYDEFVDRAVALLCTLTEQANLAHFDRLRRFTTDVINETILGRGQDPISSVITIA